MKWITKREYRRHPYFTGPVSVYFTMRASGTYYEVCARYGTPVACSGPVAWWSHDGKGCNRQWQSMEMAMLWCETDAIALKDAKKRKPTPTPSVTDE